MTAARYHKYLMKYLRRTDNKYQPIQRLLNPKVLANADYYNESDFPNTFSKEIDKTIDFEEENVKKQRNFRNAQKKTTTVLNKLNCKFQPFCVDKKESRCTEVSLVTEFNLKPP